VSFSWSKGLSSGGVVEWMEEKRESREIGAGGVLVTANNKRVSFCRSCKC